MRDELKNKYPRRKGESKSDYESRLEILRIGTKKEPNKCQYHLCQK